MSVLGIFIVCCAVVGYIRPNSVLVVCYGLLARWLRVRVRVRIRIMVRAGARECTRCLFFHTLSGKKMVTGVQVVTASQVQSIRCRWQAGSCPEIRHESVY